MAYWISHLRVAQAVKDKVDFPLDIEKYYVGSIATDCGSIQTDENGKHFYIPPRYVSHWTDNIPNWDAPIHYDRFYDTYIKNENDYSKKSFYLGYYIHLLTDAIWIELISRPLIESFETLEEYGKVARNKYRDDMYHTEVIFLRNNPAFHPLELVKTIHSFENIYLDYFHQEAIKINIDRVADNYNLLDADEKTEYPYFSCENYEAMMLTIERIVKMSLLAK